MNSKSLRIIEFDKIKDMLANLCQTDGAKRMAYLLEPLSDVDKIQLALKQTTEAKMLVGVKGFPSFGGVFDVRDVTERAEKNAVLSTKELLDVANLLRVTSSLSDYIKGERNFEVSIEEIFERLIPNRTLVDRISKAVIAEDIIDDDASPALSEIRRKMRNINIKIGEILQRYTQSASKSKYLQDNIVTQRSGRYVIPVKAEYKNEVKGLVHDVSSSGATLFIEPSSVVDANNDLKALCALEKHEIDRILSELSCLVAQNGSAIRLNYQNITTLAFLFAKADLSYKLDACEPSVSDTRHLFLKNARHPLLNVDKTVPITVSLGDSYNMLVITGPNTGGKTVTLKTIGLFSAMAQAGLHIPADEGSYVCAFDEIFSDIGDEQSIEQSLSTFSSHMKVIVNIIEKMTDRSLILFDELGAGTDPVEGAALAMSVLEEVRNTKALCAATTHYAELKAYAVETEGVSNASCEFNIETLKPTYRLIIGAPGKSNAFAISEKLGLADYIVSRASGYVDGGQRSFESVIEKLEDERRQLHEEKETARKLRIETEKECTDRLAALEKELKASRKETENLQRKAKAALNSARATGDYIIAELESVRREKNSAKFEENLARAKRDVRDRLRSASDELDPVSDSKDTDYVLPRKLKKGDSVIHKTLSTKGTVLSEVDKSGNVEVQMGIIRSRVNISDLILDESEKVTVQNSGSVSKYSAGISRSFSPTLDVRGYLADDACSAVDTYLDDATVAGVKSVTVLHGKGTGALRNAIWNMLKRDKRVKIYRAGMYGEGDYGVTVIELN